MIGSSLGDLSLSFSSRQRNLALRQDIARYTQELSTGQVANPRDVLDGNYSYLNDIERKMSLLSGYSVATTEAAQFSSSVQTIVGRLSDTAQTLANSLITAGNTAIGPATADIANEAYNTLDEIIGRLNTDVAGRFLFSGTATDQSPLIETDVLLDAARAAMTGATTPAEMISLATAWFDDPGGFAAVAYQGSDDALMPFAISQKDDIMLDLRATEPEFQQILKLTALAALAEDPAFALTASDKTELFVEAGTAMLGTQDGLTHIAARVGSAEARIDRAIARNEAEATSLSFAKANLLAVDPFEAATRLEDVQFQLQSLYTVTARNAQLSLVNFI